MHILYQRAHSYHFLITFYSYSSLSSFYLTYLHISSFSFSPASFSPSSSSSPSFTSSSSSFSSSPSYSSRWLRLISLIFNYGKHQVGKQLHVIFHSTPFYLLLFFTLLYFSSLLLISAFNCRLWLLFRPHFFIHIYLLLLSCTLCTDLLTCTHTHYCKSHYSSLYPTYTYTNLDRYIYAYTCTPIKYSLIL